jgi:hypothetical protein
VDSRSKAWSYDQQWNITYERELGWSMASRISYIGSKGTHWPYLRDLQIPEASNIPFTPARRPYGPDQFDHIYLSDLGGNSNYRALELELSRQFARGLYLRGWYNWQRGLNDVQGGLFGTTLGREIEDPYDREREMGQQVGFTNHKWRVAAVFDMPVGRGQRYGSDMPGWANHIVGNWVVAPIFSGQAKNRSDASYSGSDPANVGRFAGRPDRLSGCDPNGFGDTPGTLWNVACYAIPAEGRYGTSERGELWGPVVWYTNVNIFKTWYLTHWGESGPYFKLDTYISNFFNHNNTGLRSSSIQNASFGVFTPTTWEARQFNFRFRLGF